MKLYYNPLSPNVRRVLLTAAVLGLELELEKLDFAKGQHKSPDYLKLNPNGAVPTLVDGDLAGRKVNILRDGVECPDVSPDGTRIAFKQKTSDGGADLPTWQPAVLDLATLHDHPLAETRTVDVAAGQSRISFRGVADGLVPQTVAVEGLPGTMVERTAGSGLRSIG